MVRRSKLDLYLEVLMAIESGVNKPTNILYKCNLSYKNCRDILRTLIEQGLITVSRNHRNGRRIYKITERGRDVLKYFSNAPAYSFPLTITKNNISAHYR